MCQDSSLVFRDHTRGYFTPNFNAVAAARPDIHLFFHEPEYLIDPTELVRDRGRNPDTPVIISTVECGKNVIQDGPSFLDIAAWLQKKLRSLTSTS